MKRATFRLAIALFLLVFGLAACDHNSDQACNDCPDANHDGGDDATADDDGAPNLPDETAQRGELANLSPPQRAGGCKDCVPVAPDPWPEPDLADPTTVSWDEDNYFLVDGQRFFPIGFYRVPTDAEGLEIYKSEGFNIGYGGPGCCGSGTQPQIDLLRLAQDKGVFLFLKPWSSLSETLTRPESELEAELDERNGVGSLFGWHTFDEPALHRPDHELTERVHYILNTYSAEHPDFLVEQAMEDFTMYSSDCSVFAVDPYPSPYIFLSMVKYSVLEARAAVEDEKPVMGVMQAFSWEWYEGRFDQPFHPDAWELRNMMWQFIVLGARGLLPWNYSGDYTIHAVPEIWDEFITHVGEINELFGVILADDAAIDLDPQTPYSVSMFDYVVKQEDTADWVLSVSTNERPMVINLDVSAFGENLCVVDYTTEETFTPDEDGRIDVLYDRYQVRILEISPIE
ncbi:MAG: hypothetical protein P9L99_05940 [Candidatus Lernaella stagnicola]|nr:hypothetical protein [Candidatus Lernaella stagnicola]